VTAPHARLSDGMEGRSENRPGEDRETLKGKVAFIADAVRCQARSRSFCLAGYGEDIACIDISRYIGSALYPLSRPEALKEAETSGCHRTPPEWEFHVRAGVSRAFRYPMLGA
jgi:hypothetical protein